MNLSVRRSWPYSIDKLLNMSIFWNPDCFKKLIHEALVVSEGLFCLPHVRFAPFVGAQVVRTDQFALFAFWTRALATALILRTPEVSLFLFVLWHDRSDILLSGSADSFCRHLIPVFSRHLESTLRFAWDEILRQFNQKRTNRPKAGISHVGIASEAKDQASSRKRIEGGRWEA